MRIVIIWASLDSSLLRKELCILIVVSLTVCIHESREEIDDSVPTLSISRDAGTTES